MLIKLHIRDHKPMYFVREHIAAFFPSNQVHGANSTIYSVGITFFVEETVDEIYQLLNDTTEVPPSLPEVPAKRVIKKKIVKKKGKR